MIDNNIFSNISYGMYVVTTKNNETKSGCIINTLTQITSKDPLVTISLNKDNKTNEEIRKRKTFAVSIISEETKNELISTFGYYSSKEIDKFEKIDYDIIDDIPVITDTMSGYLICDVLDIIDCKTHDIFLARVTASKVISKLTPMTYKYYHEQRKGKSPKNAPTYIEEKQNNSTSDNKVYRCTICGHIYDDAKEKIKFVDLSDHWICPICKVGKDKFVEVKDN